MSWVPFTHMKRRYCLWCCIPGSVEKFEFVVFVFQKKPKIMGKDHSINDVNKHSTSTETLFFEKVGTKC